MILIITHRTDETTVEICCWLLSLQKKFEILELSDILEIEKISPDHISFKNTTRAYSLNLYEISTVFYRQGNIGSFQNLSLKSSDKYSKYFYQKESKIILEFIYRRISSIKHFGHPENANENKLNTLYLAKELGLQVPDYIYTGSKKELLNFFEANAPIVTKDIYL